MSKEAMKLALDFAIMHHTDAGYTEVRYAVQAALREALVEQPAQQEPVAWRAWFDADNGARWLFSLWPEEERLDVEWQPLYTSPQEQRTWVGLTEDEIYMNCPNWLSQEQCKVWIQQIEAKLKEKNNGN